MSASAEAERCALALAKNNGYAVFPCRENKRPMTPSGFKNASADPEAIRELWRRYPGPLVGIATGEVSGVSVLDVDVKHAAALDWWHDNISRLPLTRIYRTRSGGVHSYFQHREGVTCKAAAVAKGIDTRCDGGYAIHWFSVGFECLDDVRPAPWPDWLLAELFPPPTQRAIPERYRASRADGRSAVL